MAEIKRSEIESNPIARIGWFIGLGTLAILGVLISIAPVAVSLIIIGLVAFVGAIILVYRYSSLYQALIVGFIFLLFALFDIYGYFPIINLNFKLYLADGIIFLMVVLALKLTSDNSFFYRLSAPISSLLFVNFIFGFFALMIGFIVGHQLNDVIGDFRRFFLYPLAYFIPLSFNFNRSKEKKLIFLFLITLLVICSIALFRVITSQTWDPAQFSQAGDFRAIGYFTGVIVVMGLGVFYGQSLTQSGYRKWVTLMFCAFLIAVGFLSGYRLLWVFIIATPLLVTYFTYRQTKGIFKIFGTVILIILLLIVVLLLVSRLFPDWFLLIQTKFLERVIGFSFVDNIRFFAWQTAWEKFLTSPIYGVGIGDQFSFWGFDSQGNPHLFLLTTHNVFMSILYQTGIIGAIIFLAIHFRIIEYMRIKLKDTEIRSRGPIAGMFSGYLAALILGLFQPLFETPGAIVAFYLWIGLMMNFLRYYSNEIQSTVTHNE